jgi:hypothetical protein
MLRSPQKINRHFGGTYWLHIQGQRISYARNQCDRRWQAEHEQGSLKLFWFELFMREVLAAMANLVRFRFGDTLLGMVRYFDYFNIIFEFNCKSSLMPRIIFI